MSAPPEAPKPSDALADAIVEAARQAKIGITVSYVEAGVVTHIYVSDAAAELLGTTAEEVIARGPWAFIAKEEYEKLRALQARRASFAASGVVFETIIERPNKERIPVSVTATHMPIGGRSATVSFFMDITERRRAELELQASEARFRRLVEGVAHTDRLAALGSLAAGVAHEINNPLAFASLGLEALERHVALAITDEGQRRQALELIADVRLGADRVAGIVRDLKSFSRPSDDEVGPVDITAVLKSVERMVLREIRPRASFSLELPPLPHVQGNSARLEQVFVNLLLNAAQALSEGGDANVVSVRGRVTPEKTVAIEVRDNGPGMTKDVLDRIFEPFFTTKPVGVGMGLGLSVCHGIVNQLGGTITLESEVGGGTVATVVLPVSTAKCAHPMSLVPETPRSRARAKILIVDDEASVVVTLKYLLDERHDVTTLTSGEAALATLLGGEAFDLVLCDLMMPGLSGMEVHARLAAEAAGLEQKLVFMTGGAFTPRAISFLAAVPNARVEKPFSLSVIEALVDERLLAARSESRI